MLFNNLKGTPYAIYGRIEIFFEKELRAFTYKHVAPSGKGYVDDLLKTYNQLCPKLKELNKHINTITTNKPVHFSDWSQTKFNIAKQGKRLDIYEAILKFFRDSHHYISNHKIENDMQNYRKKPYAGIAVDGYKWYNYFNGIHSECEQLIKKSLDALISIKGYDTVNKDYPIEKVRLV